MANDPGFAGLLTELLEHRRMNVGRLSTASGVAESELVSLLSGTPPTASQINELAPALGLHAIDLFVMANAPVPADLAPPARDAKTGSVIASFLQITMALPFDQRAAIHRMVDQLPHDQRDRPSEAGLASGTREAGFGATLVGLLCHNRNLHSLSAAARVLALVTDGRVYLAASTLHGIGQGRVPLTADVTAGFATTLGIAAGDLAAIVGVEPPDQPHPEHPLAAEMAALLWSCRRLTAVQAEYVRDEAAAMLAPVPDDVSGDQWNRVHHHHGSWWGAPRQ